MKLYNFIFLISKSVENHHQIDNYDLKQSNNNPKIKKEK